MCSRLLIRRFILQERSFRSRRRQDQLRPDDVKEKEHFFQPRCLLNHSAIPLLVRKLDSLES